MIFSQTPPQPTQAKKIIYLIAWVILGILLSFLLHAFIEMAYISWAQNNGKTILFYGSCALHPALRIGLLLVGALFGFWQGKVWWRKVYIEHFWKKKFDKFGR